MSAYRLHDRVRAHIGRHLIFTGRIAEIHTAADNAPTYLVRPEGDPASPGHCAEERQLSPAPAVVYLTGDQVVVCDFGSNQPGVVTASRIADGRDSYRVRLANGTEMEVEWANLRAASGQDGA